MDGCAGHFVLAGFAGETACLSTAIDAFHRKHRFSYLADASASHQLGELSAADVQKAVGRHCRGLRRNRHHEQLDKREPTNAELLRRRR